MMCPTIPPSEVNGMTDMSSTKGQRLHPVWFIRDTSIKDMVEFPKQTKGHMVIETMRLFVQIQLRDSPVLKLHVSVQYQSNDMIN